MANLSMTPERKCRRKVLHDGCLLVRPYIAAKQVIQYHQLESLGDFLVRNDLEAIRCPHWAWETLFLL